ncbi:MAG: Imm50 family immunity protein [Phycisphaeraceae bacterium]
MNHLPPIVGAQKVIDVFGCFPAFHDAEIVHMAFSRGEPDACAPTIDFTLHGWEMTSDVEESGHLKLIKHHLVDFRFFGVEYMKLDGWNHQNVLFELIIKTIEQPTDNTLIEVELSTSFGLDGNFRAVSGEVLDVRPCDADGVPVS